LYFRLSALSFGISSLVAYVFAADKFNFANAVERKKKPSAVHRHPFFVGQELVRSLI
jgi:hypothetical protein